MLRVCAAAHRVIDASVASSMPSSSHLGSDIAESQNFSRLSLVQLPRLVLLRLPQARLPLSPATSRRKFALLRGQAALLSRRQAAH